MRQSPKKAASQAELAASIRYHSQKFRDGQVFKATDLKSTHAGMASPRRYCPAQLFRKIPAPAFGCTLELLQGRQAGLTSSSKIDGSAKSPLSALRCISKSLRRA
jgi:hypothetical protein